ncbi:MULTISPECIES: hypothetical protein [unclassified Ruegeria]|uniref:hypothetical protein n=1 Tax=unclassified Ruegeria TaxID=2625375 RepID=UPI001AE398FF|nr:MULTISPECIES: hypothetical protein [unclassified Ruegeria]
MEAYCLNSVGAKCPPISPEYPLPETSIALRAVCRAATDHHFPAAQDTSPNLQKGRESGLLPVSLQRNQPVSRA